MLRTFFVPRWKLVRLLSTDEFMLLAVEQFVLPVVNCEGVSMVEFRQVYDRFGM